MSDVVRRVYRARRFSELAAAKADDSLLFQTIACIVPNGTKVLVTNDITSIELASMAYFSDVQVVTGPHAGCHGTWRPRKFAKSRTTSDRLRAAG